MRDIHQYCCIAIRKVKIFGREMAQGFPEQEKWSRSAEISADGSPDTRCASPLKPKSSLNGPPVPGTSPAFVHLWQNDDFANHAQVVVQCTDIVIDARLSEGNAEAGYAEWCLRQTGAVLGCLGDESGMHSIGSRADDGMASAIRIDRDVGRRRNQIGRVGLGAFLLGFVTHTCSADALLIYRTIRFSAMRLLARYGSTRLLPELPVRY